MFLSLSLFISKNKKIKEKKKPCPLKKIHTRKEVRAGNLQARGQGASPLRRCYTSVPEDERGPGAQAWKAGGGGGHSR